MKGKIKQALFEKVVEKGLQKLADNLIVNEMAIENNETTVENEEIKAITEDSRFNYMLIKQIRLKQTMENIIKEFSSSNNINKKERYIFTDKSGKILYKSNEDHNSFDNSSIRMKLLDDTGNIVGSITDVKSKEKEWFKENIKTCTINIGSKQLDKFKKYETRDRNYYSDDNEIRYKNCFSAENGSFNVEQLYKNETIKYENIEFEICHIKDIKSDNYSVNRILKYKNKNDEKLICLLLMALDSIV